MVDMGLEERWKALSDAVDAWLDREAELDRLTDPGAAERWRAVSVSVDPEGGPERWRAWCVARCSAAGRRGPTIAPWRRDLHR